MLQAKNISNVIIFCLSLWGIYIAINSFWGNIFYFPFVLAEDAQIPYHRLQTIRIAVLLTFAYFGMVHLIKGSQQLYPIQFLSVFLNFMVISGFPILYVSDVLTTEYFILLFFCFCAIALHFASKQKYRKYFAKK